MPLQKSDLSDAVINTYYAVRGPIVARAQKLENSGKEIIYCNIGNPQALKQKPITFVRNTLAVCEQPELLKSPNIDLMEDAKEKAHYILEQSKHGLGAYSESKGLRFVRKAIADFIISRDSFNGVEQNADFEISILLMAPPKASKQRLLFLLQKE